MLETLRIKNYALIEDVEVDFHEGFNVLTGETGAGKSILVGALGLVLGARASADVVRDGAKRAGIDAVFRLDAPSSLLGNLLEERGIELEPDGRLILSRVVSADGRSRAYVSGNLAPLAVLAALGDELVDLHGQHEHQSLLKTDRQLALLDAFAGTEVAADGLAGNVARIRELEKTIGELETDDRERARRIEFMRFEVDEIDAATLSPGEEEELRSRRNVITNAERIVALASDASSALYDAEGTAAVDGVDTAIRSLEELAAIDDRFRGFSQRLTEVRAQIEEAAAECRSYAQELEFDPNELDALNERLDLIGSLKRKYGASTEEILEYRNKAAAELDAFAGRDENLEKLRAERNALLEETQQAAETLSKQRKAAARKLDKKVADTLHALGMKGGRFETRFESTPLSSTGVDRVAFFLSANPGENLKSLKQVASGGEVSRIMLALKAVFAEADRIPTLVFDEIDAGVGGQTANAVAAKLRELARTHQTICVTHMAQIAAAASTHLRVEKVAAGKRSRVAASETSGDERVKELARMLDGSLTDVSLDHARALLDHSEGT